MSSNVNVCLSQSVDQELHHFTVFDALLGGELEQHLAAAVWLQSAPTLHRHFQVGLISEETVHAKVNIMMTIYPEKLWRV